MNEYKRELKELERKLQELRGSLDLEAKANKLEEIEKLMVNPDFWGEPDLAKKLLQEANALKDDLTRFQKLSGDYEELNVVWELSEESGDPELAGELTDGLSKLSSAVEKWEQENLFNDPLDKRNALVSLHAGAGGTEAQDWVGMLFRMYGRWAVRQGLNVEVLDYLAGDEAGIKSITFLVTGRNAYGYLKAERGVHRLVRNSPFDSSGRRHTSFASVDVIPEVEEDMEVEINSDDLHIDTYRASGPGGQYVNKTDSAVRITHLPTGVVVQCQIERSQLSNRTRAMNMLRSQLLELKRREQEEKLAKLRGEQREIAWGNQIRSYVFEPYTLVKDHRTSVEVGNIQAVMNGEIDVFIESYLRL
ncbi:MAG: peptide chain release factor 2 [Syntrophaceticus sp.]|nr:peptide chain release factor 2 [Syntrophaceticus sp.]MDD4783136.1 peptide chain release factor 2 [Syntrophaceticus sp.]